MSDHPAASYAASSQARSCASICASLPNRTRWETMALKLPEASSLSVVDTPLRFNPRSTWVFVLGCTMANCFLRRRLAQKIEHYPPRRESA